MQARPNLRRRSALLTPLAALLFASTAAVLVTAARPSLAAKRATHGGYTVALAKGPGGMKIEAKTSAIEVDDAETVRASVPLAGLETGIELRDKHMKENYLEVSKFPTATLSFARGAVTIPADGATKLGKAAGKLTLHGVTVDKEFGYSIKNEGGRLAVRGSFTVDIGQHGIEVPAYMGVKVDPVVQVSTSFGLSP